MKTIRHNFRRKELNNIEINNLPDKEFQVMIIKMCTELEKELMKSVRTSTKRNKIFKII